MQIRPVAINAVSVCLSLSWLSVSWLSVGGLSIGCVSSNASALGDGIFEDFKLSEPNGSESDFFGRCVALGNNMIMVGISRDDDQDLDLGSVYLYNRFDGAPINKLFPNDGDTGDLFGASVAYENGVIAVGSVRDDDSFEDAGAVYFFDADTGVQIKKLHADDPEEEDYFGSPIEMADGVLVVGVRCDDDNGTDSGSVYLMNVETGRQTMKLLASDGAQNDWFGNAIAIDDGIIAVGALWNDNDNGNDAGAVYLFDATTGTQLNKIISHDGFRADFFGSKVALDDHILAVQASNDEHPGSMNEGSVYLYNIQSGAMIRKITPPNSEPGSSPAIKFNSGLRLVGNTLCVGASIDDPNALHERTVLVYTLGSDADPIWLYPSDGVTNDDFGYQLAVDKVSTGDTEVLVGAPSFFGLGSGSVYRFAINTDQPCAADLNGDGQADFFDVSFFLSTQPDINNDGKFDFFDVSDFVQALALGCP